MPASASLASLIQPDLAIPPLKRDLFAIAEAHLDNLTKPRGSLGRLEEIARRLFVIRGGKTPLMVSPAILFTVAGDHGVAKKKVSAYPSSVTRQMVENFLAGGGAINVLSRESGLTLCLVDAGCIGGPFPPNPMLLDRRLGEGTEDFSEGPAMSRERALRALSYGVSLARDAALEGCQCIATGEMGIANTSSATALFSALLGLDPFDITGPGTGISGEKLARKKELIAAALNLHEKIVAQGDAIDILAALGGFEIAVMSGIMLGSAAEELPFLVDGFISTAAYVVAKAIDANVSGYAFLTHLSAEPGFRQVLGVLKERPLLELEMRLGEGTGAAVCYPLLRSACAIYNDMATFSRAGIAGATV